MQTVTLNLTSNCSENSSFQKRPSFPFISLMNLFSVFGQDFRPEVMSFIFSKDVYSEVENSWKPSWLRDLTSQGVPRNVPITFVAALSWMLMTLKEIVQKSRLCCFIKRTEFFELCDDVSSHFDLHIIVIIYISTPSLLSFFLSPLSPFFSLSFPSFLPSSHSL